MEKYKEILIEFMDEKEESYKKDPEEEGFMKSQMLGALGIAERIGLISIDESMALFLRYIKD